MLRQTPCCPYSVTVSPQTLPLTVSSFHTALSNSLIISSLRPTVPTSATIIVCLSILLSAFPCVI